MQKFKTSFDGFLNWLREPLHLLIILLTLLPLYVVIVYISNYARPVPVNDQWLQSLEVASAVQNGNFSFNLITREYYGHRLIFTNAIIAFLAETTSWNVMIEIYIMLMLAVLRFVVIVMIFRTCAPQLTAVVLIPFSLLIFSAYHYLVWLSGIYSVWHFASLFSMGVVLILMVYPVGWRALTGAAFLAFCATFSMGAGTVTFPILTITLWMFGYRHWKYYAFWIALMVFALGLYYSGSSITVGEESSTESFSGVGFEHLDVMPRFMLAFIGNPFTFDLDMDLPVDIGRIGIVLFVVNIAYLWWRQRDWKLIAPWMTLAGFASSIALSVFLTRYIETRFIYAIEQRYATVSTGFWLAYVAVLVLTLREIQQRKERFFPGILMPLNVVFAVLLVALYLQANIWNWQVTARRYDHAVGYDFAEYNEETCIRDFPLYRNTTCKERFASAIGTATDETIYQLAVYHLTIFDREKPHFVLPDSYHKGSPIVIDSPSRWLNAYVREWMLDGVNEANLFHVTPPVENIPIDDLRNPLTPVFDNWNESTFETLAAVTENAEQVWYIYTPETESHKADVTAFFENRGYVALYIPISDERYQDSRFVVMRYLLAPEETEDLFRFGESNGENITLQAVSLAGENRVSPCETITVQSWWKAYDAPDQNYSATLILVNSDGKQINQKDGGLAGIEMLIWVPDLLYSDERDITVPCDAPPGDYILQFGIYDFTTLESLSVTDSAGENIGTRAPVMTITVADSE